MSIETSTGNQSTATTEQDKFSQTLESYTSLVNNLLAKSDVTDDDDMTTVRRLSSELIDEATEMEAQVEANEEAVDETQELIADTRREQADVRGDLHELTETVESDDGDSVDSISDDQTPTGNGDGDGDGGNQRTQAPETALGDCITLPETVADQELTANIKRARDVAADIIDYGRSVPAGYAITSSELRTVLTAIKNDDGRTYTETVGRVIEYLEDLGGDDVTVKQTMGGQRTVIFDDEFVRRTVAWRNQSVGNDVVTDGRARG